MTAYFYQANDNNNTKYFDHSERVGKTGKAIRSWMEHTIATYQADGYYVKIESDTEMYLHKGISNSLYVELVG